MSGTSASDSSAVDMNGSNASCAIHTNTPPNSGNSARFRLCAPAPGPRPAARRRASMRPCTKRAASHAKHSAPTRIAACQSITGWLKSRITDARRRDSRRLCRFCIIRAARRYACAACPRRSSTAAKKPSVAWRCGHSDR